MSELLSRIAVTLLATALYFAAGIRMLGAMQQCGYKNARFRAWLKRRENLWYNRLCLLFLMLTLTCALFSLCFSFLGAGMAKTISLVPFTFFLLLFCLTESKSPMKVPFVPTGRAKRLAALHAFVLAVAVYAIVAVFSALEQVIPGRMYPLFSLLPVCAVPLLLPPLFELSNAVSCAFELPRNARYVRRASKKLKKARENGCIVIGITGSYGKTSVKNMLAAILGEKYRVCATPESYNTPLGIAKTLESKEFDGAEVFIAEMGAAKTGDIKELCDLFPVDYGVFTGVCRQHSETFGGLEEIFAEKKILIDRAEKKAICGAEVYADFGDKLSAEEMKKCVFVPAGAASDVGGFPLKTSFDLSLNVGGKVEKRRVEMPVLGRGAAENAALAAYAAAEIGLSADEIFKGLALAKPVPHRLQLIEENGVYVLDDGYNASEKSAAQALEVLSAFGGRKYVVTPGIVETGLEDKAVNRPLGAKLAAFDGVFIHAGAEAVKEGYLTAGGKEENLRIYRTRDEVIPLLGELLAAGDAVLFLNDVPAIY